MRVERIVVTGARGDTGIKFQGAIAAGQFLVKAPGSNTRLYLGASGTGSDAALRNDLGAEDGALNVGSTQPVRNTLAKVAALDSSYGTTFLLAGDRSGTFRWLSGNQSAKVSSDPLKGLYIAPNSDTSGASGCWARVWDGVHGRPEWFGAVAGNPAIDNAPAINACITACPVTQLGPGKYYIGNSGMGAGSVCIPIVNNGRVLQGASQTQNNLASGNENLTATQLVVTNGYATGIRIGPASSPGGVPSWTEGVIVRNLSIVRSATINNPITGIVNAPCGVYMQYANLCEVTNVWAVEHSFGFYAGSTIACQMNYCRALRYTAAANTGSDFFAGIFLDGERGNSSTEINACKAFSNVYNVSYTYNAGIQLYKGFTDTFIRFFECGQNGYGIDAGGLTRTGLDGRTGNLSIVDPILDGIRFDGIYLHDMGPMTSITIESGYIGSTTATGPASSCVHVYECHGAITISDIRTTVPTGNPASGLVIENSSGVTSIGNQWNDFQDPVRLINSTWCRVEDRCNQSSQSVLTASVKLSNSTRNAIRCDIASSNPSVSLPAGVAFVGSGNDYNEVNCSGIYTPSITGGASNKVIGSGTGNVLSGVTA